jgi:hypothetical protein
MMAMMSFMSADPPVFHLGYGKPALLCPALPFRRAATMNNGQARLLLNQQSCQHAKARGERDFRVWSSIVRDNDAH